MLTRNEQGFTLIESLCAVVVTSLTVLLAAGLWQGSLAMERQADLHAAVSKRAVTEMERMRAEDRLSARDETEEFEVRGATVTQHTVIEPTADLHRVTLTYTWQERGRAREQKWATLHR